MVQIHMLTTVQPRDAHFHTPYGSSPPPLSSLVSAHIFVGGRVFGLSLPGADKKILFL